MSAGDVILFSRPTTWANFRADPLGTVMTALIHLTTRSRWNHAALDIGDGLMVEATNKGVAVNPIASTDEITVIPAAVLRISPESSPQPIGVVCRPGSAGHFGYLGNDLEEVLAAATSAVGWRYGNLNAVMCGLRNLIPGAAHIKVGRQMICSELVSLALLYAGHTFTDKDGERKDSALVSPGDLAEHFGVARR